MKHRIKFFFVKIATIVEGFKWDIDYSFAFNDYAKLGIAYTALFTICIAAVVLSICAVF